MRDQRCEETIPSREEVFFKVVIVTELSACIEQPTPRSGQALLKAAWNVNPIVAHHRHPLCSKIHDRIMCALHVCLDLGVYCDGMEPGPRSRQVRQGHGSGD